jgi:putative restriction endonuclease
MPSQLTSKQLLEQVLRSIDHSGWQVLILNSNKPFKLRLFHNNEKSIDTRIYIWNCTYGGKPRKEDEYRVQLTGVVPSTVPSETTLLLGWHDGYDVFVGFDIQKHDGQASSSPSIQIKEDVLQNAHTRAFALYTRKNGEIAVAFRPEFIVEYILNAKSLHLTGEANADLTLLNSLDTLTEAQIVTVENQERQTVLTKIVRKYREADFRKRVLGAYQHRCAMCGIQLELIDAAHIIPVASFKSNDKTNNGIALCKLHHSAFDRNLLSFNERYKIEVSATEVARLEAAKLVGGLAKFKQHLLPVIILPNDQRDYPPPEYIIEARKIRHWV